ncbi:MAG: hypothetical protein ACKVOK_13735 [Flavobacteriales bacterium]
MRLLSKIVLIVTLLLSASPGLLSQFYQGSNMEFGKNRVQYRDFTWFYYPGQNFDVYYYIGGEPLAEYTLMSAERNLKELEKFFDYTLDEKIQVLTYLKQSEFRQSNVGLNENDGYNIGGVARIMGNKMFVYYEGSHAQMDKQIRENVSRILFNQMMYGGDWKDVLKSSTLLSVPKWYEEGLIAYAANGATNESETFVKDLIQNKKFKSFNFLEGQEATLTGQAFWNYIAEVYGENVIPNLLYMSQASRNVESGFLYVLGLSLEVVTNDFIKFYKNKSVINRNELLPGEAREPDGGTEEWKTWKKNNKLMGDIAVKYKARYHYSQFRRSPDGKYVAFVTNELGQYRIWLYDIETKKKKCILKREYRLDRIADESFPVLAWHPSSQVLTYVFEKRSNAWIGNYSVEDKKHIQKELFLIQKIIDMSYSEDGKKIVFSGVNRGQTDLFLYQVIGNNQEQLTFDIWDDMNPRFIDGGARIIFSSNRPDDTLRTEVPIDTYSKEKDIYIFNVASRSKYLERITQTNGVDEHHPAEYSLKNYTYLANSLGYDNRYMATIDSAISAIDTTIHYRYYTVTSLLSGYHRDPKDYQFNSKSGDYTLEFRRGMRPVVYLGNRMGDQPLSIENQKPRESNSAIQPAIDPQVILSSDTLKKGEIDINNYEFEDERKDYTYEKEAIRVEEIPTLGQDKPDTLVEFVLPRSRNYRLNFAADEVMMQANNSFINPFYQNVTGPTSISPGISGLFKVGASDLFEDYKLVGGFRMAFDLQNNDYGVSFENLKGRWDKRIQLVRNSNLLQTGLSQTKIHTHSFIYQWKYPFTELASLRIQTVVRQDRIVALSNEPISLEVPNYNEVNVGLRLEYVFDNTIHKGLNLRNGTRYKIWLERYQQPDKYDQKTDFNIVGLDFRHYKRIHRDLIAAFRLAGATSFGYYKLVHYLGGVDNWWPGQRIDNSTPIDYEGQNYSFQSFVGPVRGFWVNARNGNSAVVANAEVRLPVFKYFMKKPIKSDFIENFQVVGFFDAGSAWTGNSPYNRENTFNETVVYQKPITVTVQNNREPIIYGYGFGLRSRVLGYFVRADWAWGIDDNQVLPRVFYLSLNLDF